jgi:hypothetical protein
MESLDERVLIKSCVLCHLSSAPRHKGVIDKRAALEEPVGSGMRQRLRFGSQRRPWEDIGRGTSAVEG